MLDLDDIEAKAKAATPGPYEIIGVLVFGEQKGAGSTMTRTPVATAPDPADAAHIAAASPDVVLELVRRVRAAEAVVHEVATPTPPIREARAHNDVFSVCAYCGIDEVSEKVDRHRPTCLWRRAVEAKR